MNSNSVDTCIFACVERLRKHTSTVVPWKRQHAIMATWQSLSPLRSHHPTQVLCARQRDSIPPPRPILHLHALDTSTLNCIPILFKRCPRIDCIPNSYFGALNVMQAAGPYQAPPVSRRQWTMAYSTDRVTKVYWIEGLCLPIRGFGWEAWVSGKQCLILPKQSPQRHRLLGEIRMKGWVGARHNR